MEKIHGNTLESVIETMPDRILMKTIAEMIGYIQQLRQTSLPHIDRIGSFVGEDMAVGGLIHDGPPLVSFITPRDLIVAHLQWSIERIRTDPDLFRIANHLLSPLQQVINRAEIDQLLVSTNRTYRMTHTDLNPSNIVVNEQTGKILAVLDWESVAVTFDDGDLKFYESWLETDHGQARIQALMLSHLNNEASSEISQIKPYLNVMYGAMCATFFSRTWFDDEQTVVQHVEHYVNETEQAVGALDCPPM